MTDQRIPPTKTCTKCLLEKSIDCFAVRAGRNGQRYTHCRDCRTAWYARWDKEYRPEYLKKVRQTPEKLAQLKARLKRYKSGDKGKITNRLGHVRRKFGLTPDAYYALLDVQNHQCAICKTTLSETFPWPSVDHCHVTNRVRGILCLQCNSGLGNFRDNIELLESAIEYLISHG